MVHVYRGNSKFIYDTIVQWIKKVEKILFITGGFNFVGFHISMGANIIYRERSVTFRWNGQIRYKKQSDIHGKLPVHNHSSAVCSDCKQPTFRLQLP
jgi:DNA modification methylase